MNKNNEKNEQAAPPSPEAYSQAMNVIGQSLLTALIQSLQQLPPALRSNEVVLQAVAAFLGNVLHRQSPQDAQLSHQVLDRLTKIVRVHLDNIAQQSKEPANA